MSEKAIIETERKVSEFEKAAQQKRAERDTLRDAVKRGVGWYKTFALMSMSTIVLFVAANALIYVFNVMLDNYFQQKEDRLSESLFTEKYHDYTLPQLREIRREMRRDRKFEYAPFIGYKYRPVSLEWMHIDANGFRRSKDTGPWPPAPSNLNIFVFGASTTFGFGVTDDETIPAYLQEFLKGRCARTVYVYNFGTAGYNSTAERIQFTNMLAKGLRPDVAVFIDGNIDSGTDTDELTISSDIKKLMEDNGSGLIWSARPLFHNLPMTRLGHKIKETISERLGHSAVHHVTEEQIRQVITRYTENKRLTEVEAGAYGVRTLFVWQPCPSYKFNLKYHPFPVHAGWFDMALVYAEMAKTVRQSSPAFARDFLWLADIQEHATEPYYIDLDHYRANLCKLIGDEIGRSLLKNNLLTSNGAPPR